MDAAWAARVLDRRVAHSSKQASNAWRQGRNSGGRKEERKEKGMKGKKREEEKRKEEEERIGNICEVYFYPDPCMALLFLFSICMYLIVPFLFYICMYLIVYILSVQIMYQRPMKTIEKQ